MKVKDILINICLLVMALVGSIFLIDTSTFRQNGVRDSDFVRGKYDQPEMESLLKPSTESKATTHFGKNPTRIIDSGLVRGKYGQQEMENFLKSPSTPAIANNPSLYTPTGMRDSNVGMGKYVRQETENSLESEPKAFPETVTGEELSLPKEITTVPEGSK
jgi:hypothetical protein